MAARRTISHSAGRRARAMPQASSTVIGLLPRGRRLSHPGHPEDANTIYAELQNGNIIRTNKRTGERMGIQPQVARGEDPCRWNWDSPFIISPHSRTRLYFAADRLFRSDDRGDSWQVLADNFLAAWIATGSP